MNYPIKKQFQECIRWNFVGSILYELLKTIHYFFLLRVLHIPLYGFVGTIFAIIYFATKIADLGTTYLLPPFFHLFIKNKKNFVRLFFIYFLFPQIPVILLTAGITTVIFYKNFMNTPYVLSLFVLPSLIILETFRSFLRYFLHVSFESKKVVLIELTSFISYIASIWLFLYPLNNYKLSLNALFVPHIIESSIVVSILCFLVFLMYRKIPEGESLLLPQKLWKRTLETRLFNHALRISRDLFTSNFITPLFALKFGFNTAGLLFFVGALATSLQMVIKAAISYSGYALLASVKEYTHKEKMGAFTLLSEKLITIITPLIIFLVVNCHMILKISNHQTEIGITFSLLFVFLIIICIDFFSQLYEQFYVIEEASKKLFFFRLIEFILFYFFVILDEGKNPTEALFRIALVRLIGFAIIASNAYAVWKIRLRLISNVAYIASCITISFSFLLVYRTFFN